MFEQIKKWMKESREAFRKLGEAAEDAAKPTRAQVIKALVHEFDSARHKLGESFFTRRLSPGTRRARLASLTKFERAAAKSAGWVR